MHGRAGGNDRLFVCLSTPRCLQWAAPVCKHRKADFVRRPAPVPTSRQPTGTPPRDAIRGPFPAPYPLFARAGRIVLGVRAGPVTALVGNSLRGLIPRPHAPVVRVSRRLNGRNRCPSRVEILRRVLPPEVTRNVHKPARPVPCQVNQPVQVQYLDLIRFGPVHRSPPFQL